jgi:predicted nucleic-acid-binding protein
MIGLDTNVLLRAVTLDDPEQSPKARRLISGLTSAQPGYINLVVLSEFVWSLTKRYRYSRDHVMAAIEGLLASPAFVVAERDAITATLIRMQQEPLDFVDALIGVLNRAAGADPTVTFDREAWSSGLFKTLPAGA